MNNAITHRQVMDRAGNRLELPPMATYCEPSQRAYVRARSAQAGQRIDRDRREAMALLRVLEATEPRHEPEPEPEQPADPAFSVEFVEGLIAGLAFSGVVAGAMLLGDWL